MASSPKTNSANNVITFLSVLSVSSVVNLRRP